MEKFNIILFFSFFFFFFVVKLWNLIIIVIVNIHLLRWMLSHQQFHNDFTTNFKWQIVPDGQKYNFNCGIKLESITIHHIRFFVKVLWKYYERNTSHLLITSKLSMRSIDNFVIFYVKRFWRMLYIFRKHGCRFGFEYGCRCRCDAATRLFLKK